MKIRSAAGIYMSVLATAGVCIVVATSFGLSNASQIRTIWNEFEENHTEKSVALNQILANMGYGGMIHSYKNFILRQSNESKNLTITYLGAVQTEINGYKSLNLNAAELMALRNLESTLSLYREAIDKIDLSIKIGTTPKQIDVAVKINDDLAINALNTLKQEARIKKEKTRPTKAAIVNIIRHVIGFGGMIHHYKNYILRNDPAIKKKAINEYNHAVTELNTYKKFNLNSIELKAIEHILQILALYRDKLDSIGLMVQKGLLPAEIDKQVKIDDQPALFAFQDLNREIHAQSETEATRLNTALDSVVLSGKFVVAITSSSILLIIIASFLLIHFHIVKRISRLTDTMSRLAKDDIKVYINDQYKDDEIGDMSRTLEVFRKNVTLRQKAEKELLDANINLEKRILERTQELRNNEQRLAAVLENAADSIVTIDHNGIILSFNTAATKMFGYSPEEVIDKNISMLMPTPYKEEHDQYLQRYADTHKAKIIGIGREVQAQRKDGTIFPIELAISEISNNGSTIYTGIVRDISERHQQEEKLRRSEKMDAIGKLTGGIAHDFNNMLNVIIGYSEILESELANSPKLEKYIAEIHSAGNRAAKLTRQLLDFSRHKPNQSQSTENINDIILESRNMIEKSLTARIEILFKLEPDLWQTYIDTADMENALLNLSINAMHAMEDGGVLKLSTKNVTLNEVTSRKYDLPLGDYVMLKIKDTGIGMDEDVMARIFEPFFSTKKDKGTGLGLSQVYGFVQRSQGAIYVNSTPEQGTEFSILFPKYVSISDTAANVDPATDSHNWNGSENILVVDDEVALCSLAKEILSSHGYNVITTDSGEDALKILEENEVDLLFSDVVMPKMDGFTLASIVQKKNTLTFLFKWLVALMLLVIIKTTWISLKICWPSPIVLPYY